MLVQFISAIQNASINLNFINVCDFEKQLCQVVNSSKILLHSITTSINLNVCVLLVNRGKRREIRTTDLQNYSRVLLQFL